jgi:hypothetical protein
MGHLNIGMVLPSVHQKLLVTSWQWIPLMTTHVQTFYPILTAHVNQCTCLYPMPLPHHLYHHLYITLTIVPPTTTPVITAFQWHHTLNNIFWVNRPNYYHTTIWWAHKHLDTKQWPAVTPKVPKWTFWKDHSQKATLTAHWWKCLIVKLEALSIHLHHNVTVHPPLQRALGPPLLHKSSL